MRSVDELTKAVNDLALIHGDVSEPVAKAKSLAALAYLSDEEYERAVEVIRQAYRMCEELRIENTEVGLDMYYRLGKVLETKAITSEQQVEVKEIYEKLFEKRKQFDTENQSIDRKGNYASIEEELDSSHIYYDECMKKKEEHEYIAALELLDKCLLLRKDKFGPQSSALTSMMIEKADLLKDMGRYDESKALLTELLNAIAKTTMQGRLQLPIAEILSCLGNLHRILLQYTLAEENYQECLMIRQELLPKEGHVMIGSIMNNLAELYREMELYPKAIDYHMKVLTMFESVVGKEHPGYANALGNYGITLKTYSRYCDLHGMQQIHHASQFMNAQSYSSYHPWLMKFGNEQLVAQAQEYQQQQQYLYAIGMYNLLLQRKLAGRPTKETTPPSLRQSVSLEASSSKEDVSLRLNSTKAVSVRGSVKSSPNRGPKPHIIEELGTLLRTQFSLIDQKYIALLILEKYELMGKACEQYLTKHELTLAIPLFTQCQYYADHLLVSLQQPPLGLPVAFVPTTSPGAVGATASGTSSNNNPTNALLGGSLNPTSVFTTPYQAYMTTTTNEDTSTKNLLLQRQLAFCQYIQWIGLQLYLAQGQVVYALELLQLIIPQLEATKHSSNHAIKLSKYYLLIMEILIDQGQCELAQMYANKLERTLERTSDQDDLSFSTLSYETTIDYLQYDLLLYGLYLQQGQYDKMIRTYKHIKSLFLLHPELRSTIYYWRSLVVLLDILEIYGNMESIQRVIQYIESITELESSTWYYNSSEGKKWYMIYLNKKVYYATMLGNVTQAQSFIQELQILLQDYWTEIFTIILSVPVSPAVLAEAEQQLASSEGSSKSGMSLKTMIQTNANATNKTKNLAPNVAVNYPYILTSWMANIWYVYGLYAYETLNYTEGKESFELVINTYKTIGLNSCHRNLIPVYASATYYNFLDAYDLSEGMKWLQLMQGMYDCFYSANKHAYYEFHTVYLQGLYDYFVGNYGAASVQFDKAQTMLQQNVLSPSYWLELPSITIFFPLDAWGKSLGRVTHTADMIKQGYLSANTVPGVVMSPSKTSASSPSTKSNNNNATAAVPNYLVDLLLPCWKVGFPLSDPTNPNSEEDKLLANYLTSSSPSSFHSSQTLCRNAFEVELVYYLASCKQKFHEYLDSRAGFAQSGIFAIQYFGLGGVQLVSTKSSQRNFGNRMGSICEVQGNEDDAVSTGGVSATNTAPTRYHLLVYRSLLGIAEIICALGQYRDTKILHSFIHHHLVLPVSTSSIAELRSCTIRGLGALALGNAYVRHNLLFKVSMSGINMMRSLGYYVDALSEYDRMVGIFWSVSTGPTSSSKVPITSMNYYHYSVYHTIQRDFVYTQIMLDRQKFAKAEECLVALEKPILSLFSFPIVTACLAGGPMTIAGVNVLPSTGASTTTTPANNNTPNPNDTLISYWHYQWKLLRANAYLSEKKYQQAEAIYNPLIQYFTELYKRNAVANRQKSVDTTEGDAVVLPKKHIFNDRFYYFDYYSIQNHLHFMMLFHSNKVSDQQTAIKTLREEILPFFQKFYYFMSHSPPDNFGDDNEDINAAIEGSVKLRTGVNQSNKVMGSTSSATNYGGMFPGRANPPPRILATVQQLVVYQIKARIGMLMNSGKKDSGRKLINEAMKYFDDLSPFPLPFDHPMVLEFGGYTKATSKDRLSKYLQEDTFYPWAFPTTNPVPSTTSNLIVAAAAAVSAVNQTDLQSSDNTQIPKSVFVDLSNNARDMWGIVHYYGTEFFAPLRASMTASLRSSRMAARSSSPPPSRHGATIEPSAAAYSALAANTTTNGGVNSAEFKELQEKLEEEVFLRKQKEDEIESLKHEKMDLLESLEDTKNQKETLQTELNDSKQKITNLEQSLSSKQDEFTELQNKFKEIESELNRRIQIEQDEKDRIAKEDELARKEKEYLESLKNGSLADGSEVKRKALRLYNRDETLALERYADFMEYANLLSSLGYYVKSIVLYREIEHLYRRVLQQDLSDHFIQLLIVQGKNYTLANQFTMAHNTYTLVTPLIVEWHDLTRSIGQTEAISAHETPSYLSVQVALIENHYHSGQWHNLTMYDQIEAYIAFFTKNTESPEQEGDSEHQQNNDSQKESSEEKKSPSKSGHEHKKKSKKGKDKVAAPAAPPKKHRYHAEYEVLLGKCLALLAMFELYEGKYTNAKISIEKSQISLLQGSHNSMNTIDFVDNNFMKAEIFLGLCKPKDTLAIIDQTTTILKVILKQSKAWYDHNPYAKQLSILGEIKIIDEKNHTSTTTTAVVPVGNQSSFDIDHPYLAKCHLLTAKAFIVQSQYLKARQHLGHAKRMLLTLNFPKDDLRLLEVEYYEGMIYYLVSNFFDAKSLFESLLPTLLNHSLRKAFLTSDQLYQENMQPRVALSIHKEDADDVSSSPSKASSPESQLLLQLHQHPFVMRTYYALSLLETKLGRYEVALGYLSDEILAMHVITTPLSEAQLQKQQQQHTQNAKNNTPKPPRIVTFFNNLLIMECKLLQIAIQQLTGRYKQSINIIEDLYHHVEKLFPTGDHHILLAVQYYYAENYFANQQFDEAVGLYQDNINALQTMYFQSPHVLILENELALVRLYLQIHDPVEASNQLMSAKNLAFNVYGGFLSHEVFAQLLAFETMLLLQELKEGEVVKEEVGEQKEEEKKEEMEQKEDDLDMEEDDEQGDEETKSNHSKPSPSVAEEGSQMDQSSVVNMPYFEHDKYLQVMDKFLDTIHKYEVIYRLGAGSLMSYPKPVQRDNHPNQTVTFTFTTTNPNASNMVQIISPFLQFYLGLYGEIQLMEFLAFQTYFKTLSTAQKEFYYTQLQGNVSSNMVDLITTKPLGVDAGSTLMAQQEWSKKRKENIEQVKLMLSQMLQPSVGLNEREKNPRMIAIKLDPPGKSAIEIAIHELKYQWKVETSFYYLLELQDILMNLSLQYDDMQIAQLHYFTAQKQHAVGQYRAAEISYQEALIIYHTALGLEACLSSSIIAELIYQLGMAMKSNSTQYECMKALFFLSMKIYKSYVAQQLQATRQSDDDESVTSSLVEEEHPVMEMKDPTLSADPIISSEETLADPTLLPSDLNEPKASEESLNNLDVPPLAAASIHSLDELEEDNKSTAKATPDANKDTEVNDPFIWKNIYALTSVFVDQKLYYDAYVMHIQLHDLILKAIGIPVEAINSTAPADHPASQAKQTPDSMISQIVALLTSNLTPVNALNNGLMLSFLIKTKISLANDLLNIYRYQESYQFNDQALELLKGLSKIINSNILSPQNNLSSSTSSRQTTRQNNALVTPSELTTDLLAEYLIAIDANFVEIYDYLGQFQISEDYINQMEAIFANWQLSIDQLYAPSDPWATTSRPNTTALTGTRPNTNAKSGPQTRGGQQKTKEPPTEEKIDQYDNIQLSKFVSLRIIQAQYFVVLSKHAMIVHKFQEAEQYLTEATSLRLVLFNPFYTTSTGTTNPTAGNTNKKPHPASATKKSQSTAPQVASAIPTNTGIIGDSAEYSTAKLSELKQQCFSVVKVLLITELDTLQANETKNKSGPSSVGGSSTTDTASSKKRGKTQSSVHSYFGKSKKGGEQESDDLDSRMQSANQDILQDFQSTASSKAKADQEQQNAETNDEDDGQAASKETNKKHNGVVFNKNPYHDMKLLNYLFDTEHKVFLYQGKKIPSHPLLLEVFVLFSQWNFLTNHLSSCQEYLQLVQDMLLSLYGYATFSTTNNGATVSTSITGYTLMIHRLTAKLRQSHNQIEDCKGLYLTYLEKQLQYHMNSVDYSLGISDALALLGKFSLLLGHYEDSMQYLNDALKIERTSFSRNLVIVINTFTSTLAAQNNGSNASVSAMMLILPKSMLGNVNDFTKSSAKNVSFMSTPRSNVDGMASLLTNSTTFSMTNKDYHYRIQGILVACAEILYTKGFFQDAIDMLDNILTILKNIYGQDLHGVIFKTMVLKARCLLEQSKYPDALTLLQQSKSIALIVYQDHHIQYGLLSYYIAFIYKGMGKVLEAKQVLEIAMKCVRNTYGKYHYYTVQILLEMGINFMDLGKFGTAEHVVERAIHLLKKSFGKDHMLIAYGLNAMGELQIALGYLDKIVPPLEEALFIARKNMQTDRYPLIPIILSNIATMKTLRGVYDLAIQGYEDCIAMLKLVFNTPNHYHICKIMLQFAYTMFYQGKLYEASSHFDKIYHMVKTIFQQDHVLLYEAQFGIAQCYFAMGKIDQAKALYERCLYSMKDWKGSNHPSIASILNKLADVYNTLCRLSMAETLLKEAWIIRMKTIKPCNDNHPELAETMLSLSENLRLRGILDVISKPIDKKKKKVTTDDNKMEVGESRKSSKSAAGKGEGDDQEDIEELLDTPMPLETVSMKKNKQTEQLLDEDEVNFLSALKGGKDSDDYSAPTVAISTIEMLDQDENPEEGLLPSGGIFDPMNLFNDENSYKALPLVNKAIEAISHYLDHDFNHPIILKGRHLLAEILKNLGHYEKALEMHQVLFQQRRKLLGDHHLDTIASLIAAGEILRMMKRVFTSTRSQQTSASMEGNFIGTGPKMSGNVTLLEHLVSVAKPVVRPKSAPQSLFQILTQDQSDGEDDDDDSNIVDPKKKQQKLLQSITTSDWKFLTKIDEETEEMKRRKKKPLPMPRGYMGYSFPAVKTESRPLNADNIFGSVEEEEGGAPNTQALVTSSSTPGTSQSKRTKTPGNSTNNGLLDPRKCLDLAISMLKKIFAAEDNGMSGFKKGDLIDHPYMALCLYNKAEILRLRGDGLASLKLVEQTLAMRRRLFRSHHPSIADCLFSMAELLRTDTRYPQALPIYDKAMEIRVENFGLSHPSIAEINNSLALIAIAQGNYPLAEDKLKKALHICLSYLGPEHPASLLLYTNQAGLFQAMGKLKEAIGWCKKSLQFKQNFYGELHPEIASTMNNLGLLYKAQNKYETALQMFHKALEIQKSVLGNNHPEVATTFNNIGSLLALQDGKKFEAKEYFKQSLGIRTMCYGKSHALVASTMNNYACLLYSLNEFSSAKELFEESLQIRRTILPEEHPAIGESYHNLGFWYSMQHCYLDAKYHYEEALRIRKKVYTRTHVLVATTALHLSNACDALSEVESALQYAQESLDIREKLFGGGHPETIMSQKQVVYLEHRLLHQQQQYSKLRSSTASLPGSSSTNSHHRPNTAGTGTGTSRSSVKRGGAGADNLQFDLASGLESME